MVSKSSLVLKKYHLYQPSNLENSIDFFMAYFLSDIERLILVKVVNSSGNVMAVSLNMMHMTSFLGAEEYILHV